MAAAWPADAQNMVCSPPIRSASQPQNCREKNAVPSSTESIAAPLLGPSPMSLQKATMWAIGIDIVTQQQNVAKPSNAQTTLGGSPSELSPRFGPACAPPNAGASGGRRRNHAASGTITTVTTQPNTNIVRRQP